MNAYEVRMLAKRQPDQVAAAFKRNLKGWYPSLTLDEIKASMERALAGNANTTNVLDVVIKKWFDEGISE